tara:strand:- start:3 stop:599 length:597 start_codon:yes stop_codon:yes gene_type:complete
MWARVESDTVTKIYTRPKALSIGNVNYPANIFNMWSSAELKAIGIYQVVVDNTNLKSEDYYINTNQTFAFASDTVTASYGTATAKPIADTLYTAQDETDGLGTEGEVSIKGLKTLHKENINLQAAGNLEPTDWMIIRAADGGTAVPSSITTKRAAVRTKANAMQAQIDGAANVDALAALYIYNNETPPVRPLGELPTV